VPNVVVPHQINVSLVYDGLFLSRVVLLQNFADPGIRNTEGKTPQDLADPQAKLVLSGEGGVAALQQAYMISFR